MTDNNFASYAGSAGAADATRQNSAELPALARDTTAENPWPVCLLSQKYHNAVERWPGCWVEGQLSEINTRRAGSVYITLRDLTQDITMQVSGWGAFANAAAGFKQGDRAVIYGKPQIWAKRTSLALIGQEIRRTGKGDLTEQIAQLRAKLKGEGLFDTERKKPIPEFPKCVGLICAPQARAEGDVITNAKLRWPTIRFKVLHAHVQGAECPQDIINALKTMDEDDEIDVIIVARGGGSFEDLIGFSDEGVVRAVAACEKPVVSAIGHEDDWTLIDLAADLRASTPTDAAKRVVPDIIEQCEIISSSIAVMRERIAGKVKLEEQRLEGYINRPSLTNPQTILERPEQFVREALQRLDVGVRRMTDDAGFSVEKLHAKLTALSPQSVLDRGYAVVQNEKGHILDDSNSVKPGDKLNITLKQGRIAASADEIAKK